VSTSGPAASATYLGYRTAAVIANSLPQSLSRPAAALTGRAMGLAMRGRRKMLARHLRRIHGPQLEGKTLDRAVNATFASYGRYWLEVFRLPSQDLLALDGDRFVADGRDLVDKALAGGNGLVIATPHVGNWDLGAAWYASRGYRPTTVVEPIEPGRTAGTAARPGRTAGSAARPGRTAGSAACLRGSAGRPAAGCHCVRASSAAAGGGRPAD